MMIASLSFFEGIPSGHGGNKRSYQLKFLISSKCKYEYVFCPLDFDSNTKPSLLSQIIRSDNVLKVMAITDLYKKTFSSRKLLDESYKYYMNDRLLNENDGVLQQASAVLWESTFPEFAYLPHLVKTKYRKRVIACPHNLEALIPNQQQRWYGNDKFDFLEQEIKSFKECDEIFTISEEDQWLLNLFGVKAHYLPYFPVGELYQPLYEIRTYRTENELDEYFLIVGTVENPPTLLGMTTLLENVKKIHSRKCEMPIVVTGFGTEQLAREFNTDLIKIIGSSHEKTLKELLKNCKGAIINQGFSTGALTKIPELLVAGVPIIIDEGGSRSFKRFDGVHVYKTVQDIIDIATSDLKMPKLPDAPSKLTEYFQDSLSNRTSLG